MVFVNLIRWLKGTVTFIITGAFAERFVSLCRHEGLPLWNVKRNKEHIVADTYANNYKDLRGVARKSKVKIRIKEKRGAYLKIKKHRKRIGIPIGLICAVLLIVFYSSRIWRIEVSGCNEALADWIKSELYNNGIKTACLKNKIDAAKLQSNFMIENDDIAWIAVNVVGNTVYIEVSERRDPPPRLDLNDKIANIVAAADGQIKYLEVYSGQAMVKVGETVCKGDILVSGIMEDQYGKKQFKYARAKVIARIEEQKSTEVPLKQTGWQKIGEGKERWFIDIAGKEFPVFGLPIKSEAFSITKTYEKVFGIKLIKKVYTPQKQAEITLSEKQAKEKAMMILDSYDKYRPDEKIISRTRKAEILNGIFVLTESRTVEKDIVAAKEIEWDDFEKK